LEATITARLQRSTIGEDQDSSEGVGMGWDQITPPPSREMQNTRASFTGPPGRDTRPTATTALPRDRSVAAIAVLGMKLMGVPVSSAETVQVVENRGGKG
jgi:hypothetical protein